MIRALRCVDQLKHALSIQQSNSSQSTPKAGPNAISSIVETSKAVTSELASIIQETNDAERLEELLNVNDQLLNLLSKVPRGSRPILALQGLGVSLNHISASSGRDGDGKLDSVPHINGRLGDRGGESSEASSVEGFEDFLDTPTTPKIDKGKGRAEPEPEEPEKVLSPRIQINDSEDEEDEDEVPYTIQEVGASPTDR